MIHVIKQKVGIGDIEFGMSRSRVHQVLKTSLSQEDKTDYFFNNCLRIDYAESDETVEYIEASNCPEMIVLFDEINVFSTLAEDLIKIISKKYLLDENDPELGYSYIFPEIDLSFWRSVTPEQHYDSEGLYFSSIGLGKAGYYSEI